MIAQIQAVLFDMNGTLRVRRPHPPTQSAALERILVLLHKSKAEAGFWERLEQRYLAYMNWAQERLVQLPEAEVWMRWMLPEEDEQRVAACADQLMLAWLQRKGRMAADPAAGHVLQTLRQRGFHLGVISNSISTLDIPIFIHAEGWAPYLDAVVLSWQLGMRKPAVQPFLRAAEELNLKPARCAYVGNRMAKDMAGSKLAGYGYSILLASNPEEMDADHEVPDAVVRELSELLEILPRTGVAGSIQRNGQKSLAN